MAKKEVLAKRGETVKIKINRRGKARVKKTPPERRYGPPPALDPTRRPPAKPVITVHDMTILFEQANFRERASSAGLTATPYFIAEVASPDEGAEDWRYWSEMCYRRAFIGIVQRGGTSSRDEIEWTEVISQSLLRRQVFNDGGGEMRPDPDHVPNQPIFVFDEIDVHRYTGPATAVDYRKADTCWPIPREATALGLTLKVGPKQVELGTAQWKDMPQGADDKVAESQNIVFPVSTGSNFWSDGKRGLYYSPGAFRPLIRGSFSFSIAATGHFYESWDVTDTVNFKVTSEPSYEALPVPPTMPVGKDRARVYVVPQIWAYSYNNPGPIISLGPPQTSEPCTLYEFARTIPPHRWLRHWIKRPQDAVLSRSHHHRSAQLEILERQPVGPFAPTVGAWHSYTDKLDYLSLPVVVTGYPYDTGVPDHAAIIAHNQSNRTMRDAAFIVHYETPYGSRPIVRGSLAITNTQTPEGRLVGAIKVKDTIKYVWRRTNTEREIVTLYSGKTTPVRCGVGSDILFHDLFIEPPSFVAPPVVPESEMIFWYGASDQDTPSNPYIPVEDW